MLAVKLMVAVTEAVEKRDILLSQYRDVLPEATSGIYNRAFFWWLNKIIVGLKRHFCGQGGLSRRKQSV
ncbi:hypothetical protein B0J14DRAFT_584680 [Halenospora varia]|nr:hypothetical protein B0J14DRAFT_584680 [Halenospora varia]